MRKTRNQNGWNAILIIKSVILLYEIRLLTLIITKRKIAYKHWWIERETMMVIHNSGSWRIVRHAANSHQLETFDLLSHQHPQYCLEYLRFLCRDCEMGFDRFQGHSIHTLWLFILAFTNTQSFWPRYSDPCNEFFIIMVNSSISTQRRAYKLFKRCIVVSTLVNMSSPIALLNCETVCKLITTSLKAHYSYF